MKIGVIADIHANLPALEAVIAHLRAEKCVRIVCLGDVVGYGPHPTECVARLRDEKVPTILGNHDAWCANELVVTGISSLANEVLLWTRKTLGEDEKLWLSTLPKELYFGGLHFTHTGCLPSETAWPYVRNGSTLAANFAHQKHHITFYGHTHVPALGTQDPDQSCSFRPLEDVVVLRPEWRALINPGSVGQPRDADPRAACVVFETRDRSVHFHRCEYDVLRTLKDLAAAGLNQRLGERLAIGR